MKKITTILVTSFLALLSGTALSAQSGPQARKVEITVIDGSGPVIGAGIFIKETTIGVFSDMDGKAELTVAPNTVISVSCLGYQSQDINIGNRTSIQIRLEEEYESLEGVVMVGYGVQKKESLTSAITQIAADDITNTKHADAVMSLQGKVPGLLIREQSGKPGDFTADLSLRGYGKPMIVVDGVVRSDASITRRRRGKIATSARQYEEYTDMSSLQEINPDDIESISVLKDASATIYGLGAENGVILITTKKGTSNKPSISYSASLVLSQPVTNRQVESWDNFMLWDNAMSDNAKMAHRFSDEEIASYQNGGYEIFDWYNEIVKKVSVTQQHNFSVSGGTDQVRYRLSLGYVEDNSMFRYDTNNYNRYNLSGTVTAKLTKDIEAKYTTALRVSNTTTPGSTTGDWNMFYYIYAADPRIFPTTKLNSSHFSEINEHKNPVAMLQSDIAGYGKTRGNVFQNTVDLTYTAPFLKGLKFSATGAYDLTFNHDRALVHAVDTYDYESDTYVATWSETNYSEMYTYNTRLYGRLQANYERQFGKHSVAGTLGAELSSIHNSYADASRKYGATQAESFFTHDTIDMGLASTAENKGTRTARKTAGYIGRINYNYEGKYLVELMGRYDGSYIYAPGHRWGLFPSYSLGWRISEESFFKKVFPHINNLKIRWSDGKTGSVQGNPYAYIGGYSVSGSWILNEGVTTTGYDSSVVENTILSWADVRLQDIGLDWEIAKGKFGGSFDWYRRQVIGIAATRSSSLPDFYGVSLPSENLNTSETQGLELSLSHHNTVGKFNYRITANATYYRSRTTYDIKEDPDNPDHTKYASSMSYWKNSKIGRWDNTMGKSRYEWTGAQFQNLEEISGFPILYSQSASEGGNATLLPGMYQIVDKNGNGYIDNDDVEYVWPEANPPLQFGLSISGSYNRLDFSLVFSGAALKTKGVSLSGFAGIGYLYQAPKQYTSDCWHVANYGDDPWDPATQWEEGYWPALVRVATAGASHNATYTLNQPYNLPDATYLRLKNLEIGYRINAKFLNKVGIKNSRIYFNGGNLLTFCNRALKYVDPESTDNGRQGGQFQINRTYNFGITLNF